MISTLLNYRLYADDFARSVKRVEADPVVQRDAQYYKETIGDIRTVDEFMSDRRLYSYALKAYGLSDQADSQALIRKVLESDLSDEASFVNRLSDSRFREFAAAFDFRTATAEPVLQSAAQTERVVEAYSEHRVRSAALAAEKTAYYERRIAAVETADEFVADDVLFEVAARIIGLDPSIASRDYVRGVLVGDIEDDPGTNADDKLAWLSQQFGFDPDGSLPEGVSAQGATAVAETIHRYNVATGNGVSPQAAAHKVGHYEGKLESIATADDLVFDPMMFDVVMTAFGFDPSIETPAFVRNILASDPNDPSSTLAQMPETQGAALARKEKFKLLNAAFRFDAQGNAEPGGVQAPEDREAMIDRYYASYRGLAENQDTLATNSFRVRLSKMDSLSDLLARDGVLGRPALDYILKAFDLDPATTSLSQVRRVLTSDPSDPASYVSRLGDERWSNLAAAFNFDAEGKLRPERLAQSVRNQENIALRYSQSFGTDQSEAEKARVRAATEDYLRAVGSVASIDDLLDDPELTAYALKAFGLEEEKLTRTDIRALLTSDLADPASFANSFGDARTRDFAASFNFQTDGSIGVSGTAQRGADIYSTQNLYLLQTLEERAGETSEGTRLALYFLRKAPEITSPLSILADKALFEVARTALGLPISMAQQDIDRQAAILEERLDVADFADPAKLDRFISRFAALYDAQNGTGQARAPVLALFGNVSSASPGILGLF